MRLMVNQSPQVRKAILAGNFKLKPVATSVTSKPVVGFLRSASLDNNQRKAITNFDKKKLRHVQPRVATKTVVVDKSLSTEEKKAILSFDLRKLKSVNTRTTSRVIVTAGLPRELQAAVKTFPNRQLNHVVPRVTVKPAVIDNTSGLAVLRDVVNFEKNKLRHVSTRVSNKGAAGPADKSLTTPQSAQVSTPQPAQVPAVVPKIENTGTQAADFLANLTKLAEFGFTDRKRNIRFLVESKNNIAETVAKLLDN